MEKINAVNQNFTNFEDLLIYFDNKYYDMIENMNKLDNLFWELEKEGLNSKLVSILEELVNPLDKELKKLFEIENYIYPEMEDVLPEQSSVSALKFENESILTLLNSIKSLLNDKENVKKHKDLLQAELISAAELIQRNINKKESIMFHEARTLIPEDRLDKIVYELKINNILTS